MKVFWAWQSDRPGKTSRHFIKECLEEAITALNDQQEIAEPDQALQSGYELDHDRKNVSGSPDLANEILEKISNASVFVGDVTPVGEAPSRKDKNGVDLPGKKLMNPNVAIELGYALKVLGSKRILMVLNEHFGGRESVPFDLAHKAGPIMYRLAPESTADQIKSEKKKLVALLKVVLEQFQVKPQKKAFEARPHTSSRAYFAPENYKLGEVGVPTEKIEYRIQHEPAVYLRVRPTEDIGRILSKQLLTQHIYQMGSFGRTFGGIPGDNDDGVCCIDPKGNSGAVLNLSQALRSGELWGINTEILGNGALRNPKLLLQAMVEELFIDNLPKYLRFMRQVVRVDPPYTVDAGLVPIRNWHLYNYEKSTGPIDFGEMYVDEVAYSRTLKSDSAIAQNEFLLGFFEEIFSKTGNARPTKLNGFP